MASSTLFISLLFLITLSLPCQLHARERHFFSKMTPFNDHGNDAKEEELRDIQPETSRKESVDVHHGQKPTFIPETQNNNYGLYGQDSSDQFPPSTTTSTENIYEGNHGFRSNNDDNYYFNSMSNQKKYNPSMYDDDNNAANGVVSERQGMSDTRYLEGGRYYYDINAEKFNPAMYGNSRRVERRNWYGRNNKNMYDNYNSMYQNQQEVEDDQKEFQP